MQEFLFSQPVITVKTVQTLLGVTPPTANSLVTDLEEPGLLREWTGQRHNRSSVYQDYVSIFRERTRRE